MRRLLALVRVCFPLTEAEIREHLRSLPHYQTDKEDDCAYGLPDLPRKLPPRTPRGDLAVPALRGSRTRQSATRRR
jgi:hypothetical protein